MMYKVTVFPGQGSQKQGMGKALFDTVPEYLELAEQIDQLLGYSLQNMCLQNPDGLLMQTQVTQPCLYLINALHYLDSKRKQPDQVDFFGGHSLGEYNALFAAGAFSLLDGLKLVIKRGELMSRAKEGGMAAVVGLSHSKIEQLISDNGFDQLEVANFNSPGQTVISGSLTQINQARAAFDHAGVRLYKPLPVSAAFHSRYMKEPAAQFRQYLATVHFNPLHTPVLSNATGQLYPQKSNDSIIRHLLALQIESSVQWVKNIQCLLARGPCEFEEVGEAKVLSRMIKDISTDYQQNPPVVVRTEDVVVNKPVVVQVPAQAPITASIPITAQASTDAKISGQKLGSDAFKRTFGLRYAYVTGSMYKGIASVDMVVKVARMGALGFFGAGGLSLSQVEQAIVSIKQQLNPGQRFGVNLLANISDPAQEMAAVGCYLKHQVRVVEASAFMQMSAALVKYRLGGIHRDNQNPNIIVTPNHIVAKVSRPEVARLFMSAAPQTLLDQLLQQGDINAEQAELAALVPMAGDITIEADSGGHTDQGVAYALMPAMTVLRDEMQQRLPANTAQMRLGAAGGIGAPAGAAAAFMLGADYIATGSINQCTVEAGTSDLVKDLLQDINVQDTAYAPAGDMFELGAKVQVMRKGVFFAARANKLYDLYQRYDSLEAIDDKTRAQIERVYFKQTFEQVWQETRQYCAEHFPQLLAKAEQQPKQKMALVFRWYFGLSTRVAMAGDQDYKVDFQIQTGPAMGAFNQWVKGTGLESWRGRHVDVIGMKLMDQTAQYIEQQMARFSFGSR
jgi:trans-AT polyketide synthase/acyltransferase/oxidoreductase domain-containing protein